MSNSDASSRQWLRLHGKKHRTLDPRDRGVPKRLAAWGQVHFSCAFLPISRVGQFLERIHIAIGSRQMRRGSRVGRDRRSTWRTKLLGFDPLFVDVDRD